MKKKKLRVNLNIGENVLLLAERIKKKDAAGKFLQKLNSKCHFFNKERLFGISNKKSINNKMFYWVADVKNKRILQERILKTILYEKSYIFE